MGKKDVKSEMGDFIPDSVDSAVIPTVKQNTPFVITEKGKHLYVGMLLDVTKIGGINKKSVNDKDKGGVIEAIKSGHIDAFVTPELNEKNQLLFIPTTKTIDRLSDYGMFRRVDGYEFVKLNDKLEIVEYTGVTATYDEYRMIALGNTPITDYVKPADVIIKGSDEDPTVSHNTVAQVVDKAKDIASSVASKVAPVVSNVSEKIKDKIAETTGIKDMQDAPAEKPAEQAAPQEQAAPAPAPAAATETQQSANDAQPEEDEQEVVYTETQVLSSVERVFHANNLDLTVSSDPFDQLFTLNNHLIKFDVDPRDSFVNERLNRMAIDANRDLQKLRSDNLKKLREKYFMLMALRVQEIANELDIENHSTSYGEYKQSVEDTKTKAIEELPDLVEKRQKIIEEAYNKRMEEVCENAARQARVDFKNRYQRQHNDDMNAVEGKVRAEIEANYTSSMNELFNARRNDALTSLDYNVTGVLQVLTEDYKKMFEEETALYNTRANEMREYAKELHMLDAKRLAVEEEHNRITNEVNDARAEASAKIELIKREYETAQAALEARTAATISQAENENKLIKEQMDARTATLEQDKDRLQKQLDDAIDRADKAQEIVRADYEHRLIQAQDDRDSWKQTLESYKEQHKHNNRLAAILVVAITVAAVCGGFVAGGVYWNRIVSGELAGNQENVEIKVVNPDAVSETTAETTIPEIVDEALTDSSETQAVTTVPANANGSDDVENMFTKSETTAAETTVITKKSAETTKPVETMKTPAETTSTVKPDVTTKPVNTPKKLVETTANLAEKIKPTKTK